MGELLELNLDGLILTNKEELHSTIFYQLTLPDYYGRNLDALWDVLSTWSRPLYIEVTHVEELIAHLSDDAQSLLDLLRDAELENNMITLNIS